MSRLAQWIREQLRHSDIPSPTALARKASISSGTMTNIMRHGVIPGPDIVRAIAHSLGANEAVALEVAGYLSVPDVPQDWLPELKDAWAQVQTLPPQQRELVLAQLRLAIKGAQSNNAIPPVERGE